MSNFPTEAQIAGNILIAQRIGWTYVDPTPDKIDLYPNGYYESSDGKDWSKAEDLKFHSDGTWLMQAAEFMGFDTIPSNIEEAFNQIVNVLKTQAN